MNIDEAIEKYKKIAEDERYNQALARNDDMFWNEKACEKIADEYSQLAEWLEELKAYREKELKHIHDILPPVPNCKLFDVEKVYRDEHDKQIRADERNNVLSTLKKLIDSDYKSKDCQLLFADLCEMLVEQLKEQK